MQLKLFECHNFSSKINYSKLTTLAQAKGDSGAEAIAMEIGAYMGEVTQYQIAWMAIIVLILP